MPTPRSQKLMLTIAVILVIAAGSVVGLYLYLPRYVQATLIPEIGKKLGLETREAAVRRISLNGIDIGPVKLGTGARSSLSVQALRIDFSLKTLLRKKITAVSLIGLRVRCDIEQDRIVIAGVDPASLTSGKTETAAPLAPEALLPVDIEKIFIRDAVLDIYRKERHLAVPIEMRIDTAALDSGQATLAATLHPHQARAEVKLDLDLHANRVGIELDTLKLDLADAAELYRFWTNSDITAAGALEAGGSAIFGLSPLALQAMAFHAGLSAAAVTVGAITLKNIERPDGGNAEGLIVSAEADSPHKMTWSIGPAALVAPMRLNILKVEGAVEKMGEAIELRAQCRTSLPAQKLSQNGKALELLSDLPLSLTISAVQRPQAGIDFEIKTDDTEPNTRVAWKSMQARGQHDLSSLGIQGTRSPVDANLSYTISLSENHLNLGVAHLRCPDVNLDGRLNIGHTIQGKTTLRLIEPSATSSDFAANIQRILMTVDFEKSTGQNVHASGDVRLEEGSIEDPSNGITMQSLSAALPFSWPPVEGEKRQGHLALNKIVWRGRQVGSLKGRLFQKAESIGFDLRHESKLFPGLFVLIEGQAHENRVELLVDLPSYKTSGPIDLGRLTSSAQGFAFQGRLSGKSRLEVKPEGLSGGCALQVDQGRLSHKEKQLEADGITARLQVDDLAALKGSREQRMGFSSLTLGNIKTGSMDISFQLLGDKGVRIQKGVLNWCRGEIQTASLHLKPDFKQIDAVLICRDLDLAMLLEQLGLAQGQSDATVSGRIPVRWNDGRLRFDQGYLASPEGQSGIIRLHSLGGSEQLLEGLPPDTPQRIQIDIARQALKDYTYHGIRLSLESEKNILKAKMQLKGKPNQLLPFVYDQALGQFKRVKGKGFADFKGIDIDLNLRSPLDEILNYKDLLKPAKQ